MLRALGPHTRVVTHNIVSFSRHSLVPSPCTPPSKKQSGERSRIAWVCSQEVVRTNEIARLVILTKHFLHNSKIFYLYSSIRTFFERVWHKMFWMLLGYTVAEVCTSPRNSTLFTRLFLPIPHQRRTRLLQALKQFSDTCSTYSAVRHGNVWEVQHICIILARCYVTLFRTCTKQSNNRTILAQTYQLLAGTTPAHQLMNCLSQNTPYCYVCVLSTYMTRAHNLLRYTPSHTHVHTYT